MDSINGTTDDELTCPFTSSDQICYTASWILIRDQLWVNAFIQGPVILVSFLIYLITVYNPDSWILAKVTQLLDSALVQVVNSALQLIGSIYICVAWVARAGSLAVNFSAWTTESGFYILLALSYVFRWLAASNKLRFALLPHSLFDLLSLTSHFSLSIQTIPVSINNNTAVIDNRSWLDFGFLRSYILYAYFGSLFSKLRRKTFLSQILMVTFQAGCLIFFVSSILFTFEYLGEVPSSESFLFHVYSCPREASNTTTTSNVTSTFLSRDASEGCVETWSAFTAIYFMFVTVSTVGYGDFSPSTVLGRAVISIFIIIGIYMFANETTKLVSVYEDQRSGRHSYKPLKDNILSHIVICGNPSVVQLKDFVREFFHPDHVTEDHNTSDVVVLISLKSESLERSYFESVREYCDSHLLKKDRSRVVLLAGSALNNEDLMRCGIQKAKAVFFLPNKYHRDANAEDAANVIRVLSVAQCKAPATQMYVMVLNSDNQVLFSATGISDNRIIASDSIKLALMGLSCRCRAISTLLANLISSRSAVSMSSSSNNNNWMEEYMHGASNEIYACYLSSEFDNMSFIEAVNAVYVATDGNVLVIAVEDEDGKIEFNPGHRVIMNHKRIKSYVIAEDSVVFKNITMTNTTVADKKFPHSSFYKTVASATNIKKGGEVNATLKGKAQEVKHRVARRVPESVERDVKLYASLSTIVDNNTIPPSYVLSEPHVIVFHETTVASGPQSLSRLCKFVQPLRALHVEHPTPIIIVDPATFDPEVWAPLSVYKDVYHVCGSPLNFNTLTRAGIASATAIVILAQGSNGNNSSEDDSGGYDDSKAIFNTILVDSAVKTDPSSFTLLELTDVFNNKYLDPITKIAREKEKLSPSERKYSYRDEKELTRNLWSIPTTARSYIKSKFRRFFEIFHQTKKVLLKGDVEEDENENDDADFCGDDTNDSFFQERYVTGGLFPSFVADDLLIQSYFNSSIIRVVRTMMDGSTCFALYAVPAAIVKDGLTYGEVFRYMTSGLCSALPIGLLRAPSRRNKASAPYVYTSPYSHTVVNCDSDKIFVMINHYSLHRAARKMQKMARSVRVWKQ